jgi:hypothetical protein
MEGSSVGGRLETARRLEIDSSGKKRKVEKTSEKDDDEHLSFPLLRL